MDTPLTLLKTTVSENSTPDRISTAIRACKLITDVLPFAKDGKSFLEKPELITYLMISTPFNPRSIEWLVSSMIDKFKYDEYFLRHMWVAFTTVAFLNEKETNESRKASHGLKRFQLEAKKALAVVHMKKNGDGKQDNQIIKDQAFCQEILENKETIKISCLKHIKKFIDIYFKELKDILTFKPDFVELLKKFIVLSYNGNVIVKAVKILEKLRQHDPFSYDIEIDEILLNKQSLLFNGAVVAPEKAEPAQPQRNWARSNTIFAGHNKNKFSFSKVEESEDCPEKPEAKPQRGFKRWNSLLADVLEVKAKGIDLSSQDKIESELDIIEEWLASRDISQASQLKDRDDIQESILNTTNFENLLLFIFEPDTHTLGACWEKNYSSLLQSSEETRFFPTSHCPTPPRKNQSHLEANLCVLRSFKTMQALCDEENYKCIFEQNKEFIETYFNLVYNALIIKEEGSVNYEHVGLLTEVLIIHEPELCIGFILHFNLIYKFIQNIRFKHIQKMLFTLFKCSENTLYIEIETYRKLLRYCESSQFFPDLGQAVLNGWNSFEASKFNMNYKPPGVETLVSTALEGSLSRAQANEQPIKPSLETTGSSLLEETYGFQVDIDRLQPILEANAQVNRETMIQNQRNSNSTPRIRQKRNSKYPSLIERTSISTRDETNTEELKTMDNQGGFESINSEDPTKNSIIGAHNLSTSSRKDTTTTITDAHTADRKIKQKTVAIISNKSKSLSKIDIVAKSVTSLHDKLIEGGTQKIEKGKLQPVRVLDFTSVKDPTDTNVLKKVQMNPEGIIKKVGRYTQNSLDVPSQRALVATSMELPKKEEVSTKVVNRFGLVQRRKDSKAGARPVKNALHKQFDQEVLDKEMIKELDRLYPTPLRAKTEIEMEASKEQYSVGNIRENENFSLVVCEFLEVLFRKPLLKPFDVEEMENRLETGLGTNLVNQQDIYQMKRKYELKRAIGVPNMDFGLFWQSVFSYNCALFEGLLKNYLFKIKLHHIEETNSGYSAGLLVNLILEEWLRYTLFITLICFSIKGNPDFEPYTEQIQMICKKYFPFLCKTIIQSYAWIQKESPKVYLQEYEVKNPLGTGRILLVETLKLFIENDYSNNYQLSSFISDTCWHVLSQWFFNNKTNNIYHQMFCTIVEITFLYNNESIITNLLFKLGLVAGLYKVWSEIYQNNMLRKDKHIDSILYHLRKLSYLIDSIAQEHEDYKVLKRELKRSLSWEILQSGLSSIKDSTSNQQSGRPESQARSQSLFSPPIGTRRRRDNMKLDESIPIEEFDRGINETLRELDQALC